MTKQAVLFLSHGAPPLADDPIWPDQLRAWGKDLGTPSSVLIVCAHWERRPITISATVGQVPLVYDFYGFPEHYYRVTYPTPTAPGLADEVTRLMAGVGLPVDRDESRGLDHGAYVPLKEMFPQANIPTLQVSMPTLDPGALFTIGRALAPLRDQGTLIIGSGFTTHNLRWVNFGSSSDLTPPVASSEFDAWARDAIAGSRVDDLVNFLEVAPHARQAHPRIEHFAPLFVAMGAGVNAEGTLDARSVIDGFWFSLSKRSWQFA